MRRFSFPTEQEIRMIAVRPRSDHLAVSDRVREIFAEVKSRGDDALRSYTEQFDGVSLNTLSVSSEEFERAEASLPDGLKRAIRQAFSNIRSFHEAQREPVRIVETSPGVRCWRKSLPISPIGLYIPGGSAPLFSTALMLGIPAQIAGCEQITVCTPPDRSGAVHPAILFSLALSGIRTVIKCGGAQAIAALGFGSQTISASAKIFGPGNRFVTAAKQMIMEYGVAIDMLAGPSEVAVLADESARVECIAADLLSQAEHGADSQVLYVTTSNDQIERVEIEIRRQLELLPRRDIAAQALAQSSAVLVSSLDEGMAIVNQYAPEHLIIAADNSAHLVDSVVNAGSVFIGQYSPESVGDYASGTNHTLPTNGYARQSGGVSLDSFVKKVTFQELSRAGLEGLASTVEAMADAEGLTAHARAVSIRLEKRDV